MRYDTKRLLDLLKKSVTNIHSNGIFNMKNPPVVPTGGLKTCYIVQDHFRKFCMFLLIKPFSAVNDTILSFSALLSLQENSTVKIFWA